MVDVRQVIVMILLTSIGSIVVISWMMLPNIAYMFYGEPNGPSIVLSLAKASQGAVIGSTVPEGAMFKGIPFSQPPKDEYRFKDPRPPIAFPGGVWNATYPRAACVQDCDNPVLEYSCPQKEIDEDCLYLNVWVPHRVLDLVGGDEVVPDQHYVISDKFLHDDNSSFAVMIFFHGGNFLDGSGSVTLYDGRYLAQDGDVIIVTANYRVGPLGFLVQDSLKGNYGSRDQIKALEWVQNNIKYFGGNSKKVTIFGQSAGAESIGVLMTSPYGKGLFQQAIMESNPFGLPFRTTNNAKKFGNKFVEAAGCKANDLVCMRNVSTEVILRAFKNTKTDVIGIEKLMYLFQPWGPVIDGEFLPKQPVDAFIAREVDPIPMIIGSTADEGMIFMARAFRNAISNIEYEAILLAIMKLGDFEKVRKKYPPQCDLKPTYPCDNRQTLSNLTTDYVFICPQRISMRNMNYENIWFYMMNQTWSFFDLWEEPLCYDKVCHGAELVYVFDVEKLVVIEYTPRERLLSHRMQYYWSNFAKYGNPNGNTTSAAPDNGQHAIENDLSQPLHWPRFTSSDDSLNYHLLQFKSSGDFIMNSPFNDSCNFWDKVDAYADHFQ